VINVVRSEILKLRTTNVWWLFGIGIVVMTAISFFINAIGTHFQLHPQEPDFGSANVSAEDRQQAETQYQQDLAVANSTATLLKAAANLYTSGQFFGALFVMILGALIVTNEFAHQTATATFLTKPHRTTVIVGKLIAGVAMAAFYWLITTVLDVITLIRQYLIKQDWVDTAQVILPAVASQVMVTVGRAFEHAPPQWVGALVLIGYGVVAGLIGTLITRRRDIS
jgi:ABC-2 type transport system permease protein